ncbi:class I SAM-dependent methyltransferase [Micromonospora sp. NPDC050686]|uniref:class I SAM-dependent methyltransferase n=1 Tax=Micromonospora sp. NPDC050686 TaxID=3154631 RepID=UPI00340FBE69
MFLPVEPSAAAANGGGFVISRSPTARRPARRPLDRPGGGRKGCIVSRPINLLRAISEKRANLHDGLRRTYRRDGSGAAIRFAVRWGVEGAMRPANNVRHRRFDRRLGIETTGRTGVTAAMRSAAAHADGTRYEAMAPHQFRRILRRLPLGSPADFAFVDLGSGKGLPLLLAAEHGFGEVVGVELNRDLIEMSRRNVRSFEARRPEQAGVIAVHHDDAAKFTLPSRATVLFLFNPFGAATLRVVVDNVERSLKESPRRFFVIYGNPLHREVLDERPMLRRLSATTRWALYDTAPARP